MTNSTACRLCSCWSAPTARPPADSSAADSFVDVSDASVAGVAGVAIGFAAKDTLSNLIAGILLIIDRPFEVGDRIEVWSAPAGSATWGDVIDIGLRATKIKTTDNIVIIIPNNEIMLRDIINYTIISENIRVRINIGIAYDADLKKAKNVSKVNIFNFFNKTKI